MPLNDLYVFTFLAEKMYNFHFAVLEKPPVPSLMKKIAECVNMQTVTSLPAGHKIYFTSLVSFLITHMLDTSR